MLVCAVGTGNELGELSAAGSRLAVDNLNLDDDYCQHYGMTRYKTPYGVVDGVISMSGA